MSALHVESRNGVCVGDSFRTILEQEAEAVRGNGHSASLLVLDVSRVRWNSDDERKLSKAMAQRARHAGAVGWIDGHHVGLLMMDRSYAGACRMADLVERDLSSKVSDPVRLDLYLCPSKGERKNGSRHGPWPATLRHPYGDKPVSLTQQAGGDSVEGSGPASCGLPLDASWEKVWSRVIAGQAVRGTPLWKRVLDLLGASFALVLLSPVMLFIAAGIKILSPGPALFKQERVGYLGRTFICWKFRSMRPNASTATHRKHLEHLIHSDQPMAKLDKGNDERLLPWGRLLRSSGMDELPQLFNVLRGEMSLVGPRPCIPYEYEHYYPWHKKRFDTLPGLTGLWQVSGKNRTTFNEMMHLDIEYVQNRTLWMDLAILARTVPTVFREVKTVFDQNRKRGKNHE